MMPNRHSTPSAADLLVILATSALLSACAIASAEPTLANPGFEDGQAGWDAALFQRHEGLVVIDRQKGRGGNVSLRIGNRRGTENAELAQTIEGIEPGTGYEATVWVVSDGASTPILAGLRLEFLDADGKLVSRRQTRRAVGSQDWQELRLNATAGLDARKVRLRLQVFGQGTIWFDDVRLKTLGPPSGLVIEPERQRIDAGRGARVRVTARLPQPWQGESAPPFKVSANRLPDGAAHSPDIQVNQTAPDRFDISFELPSVTAGGYRITCALPDGKGLAQSMVYVPAPNRKPAGLSDDGIIMADKERFFPIGLCHVGVRSYPEVARQGFNCVQGAASLDPAALGSALKAAQDAGLLVDVPLYAGGQVRANLPASAERIRRYAQHPAVLSCWTSRSTMVQWLTRSPRPPRSSRRWTAGIHSPCQSRNRRDSTCGRDSATSCRCRATWSPGSPSHPWASALPQRRESSSPGRTSPYSCPPGGVPTRRPSLPSLRPGQCSTLR